MVRKITFLTLLTGMFIFTGCQAAVSSLEKDGWKLVWSDEFDKDGQLDPLNWTYEQGFVRNEELQWYQPENAFCENGLLVIEGRRERVENRRYREDSRDWRGSREYAEYTAASVKTQGLRQWQYGRFEIRAKIDVSLGMWPAIWTLGVSQRWPNCGEIDIMEYYQHEGRGHLLANTAWGGERRRGAMWNTVRKPLDDFLAKDPDWASKFHIWRMDWDENFIRLYLDDELMNETDLSKTVNADGFNPFRQPHYLLLNLAIGSRGGDPGGTAFPKRYEIDYVRVYQKERAPVEKRTAFESGAIWPDDNNMHINAHGGGILVHEGTYYWFGEHKISGWGGNSAQVGVRCYSSKDLYNWKDEGVVLAVSDDPQSEIVRGSVIERPKVIYNKKTGKFVMWFHLELRGQGYAAARAGRAAADNVTGPYTYLGSSRVNPGKWPLNISPEQKEITLAYLENPTGEAPDFFSRDFRGGQMSRDMTLFVDDDGRAYHVYASEENRTLQIAELSEDYLSHSGRYVRVFHDRLMEAPTLFKYKGRYYFIGSGCTGWAPNAARSAAADSIWGPWTELGNPCRGTAEQNEVTFESQSTYVLPVPGREGAFIFMADRWQPRDPIDGRYIWLPVEWEDGKPVLRWYDKWDLGRF